MKFLRSFFLVIILIVATLAGIVYFMPLGYIMGQSGLGALGAGWAQVDGTIRQGRIDGLHVQGQPIGDVTLSLKPLSLLSLTPTYQIQWGGAGGRGNGTAKLSSKQLELTDIRMEQTVASIEGLSPALRAVGGSIRVSDGDITLSRLGCEDASGQISSDVLTRAAQQYGRQFGTIEGQMSCDAYDFLVDLQGQSDAGDVLDLTSRSGFDGRSELTVEMVTQDSELSLALAGLGFSLSNGTWSYNRTYP